MIPWKKFLVKLGGWLLDRGEEEAVKEVNRQIERREGDPQRRTGLTPPPSPDQ